MHSVSSHIFFQYRIYDKDHIINSLVSKEGKNNNIQNNNNKSCHILSWVFIFSYFFSSSQELISHTKYPLASVQLDKMNELRPTDNNKKKEKKRKLKYLILISREKVTFMSMSHRLHFHINYNNIHTYMYKHVLNGKLECLFFSLFTILSFFAVVTVAFYVVVV